MNSEQLIFYYNGYKHLLNIEKNDLLREILKKFMKENNLQKRSFFSI